VSVRKENSRKQKEPIWLEERDVRMLHSNLLALHGGICGEIVPTVFTAILLQPMEEYANGETDLLALAASYAANIAQERPFKDGNRRTALVACVLFLNLNGYELMAPEVEMVHAITELSREKIDERGFRKYLQANVIRHRRLARPLRPE
jgi:death on curing protein